VAPRTVAAGREIDDLVVGIDLTVTVEWGQRRHPTGWLTSLEQSGLGEIAQAR